MLINTMTSRPVLTVFLGSYTLLTVLFFPFWSTAFPVGDELPVLLIGTQFDFNRWFITGGADFFDIYPGWIDDSHQLVRPLTQVMTWILFQLHSDLFAPLSYYQLHLLLGTYLWAAGCAALIFAVAYRLYQASLFRSTLLALVMLSSGPVMAWPVPQWPMNGFDLLSALFLGATVLALARARAGLSALCAILACVIKEGSLIPILAASTLALGCPRTRKAGLAALAGPMAWAAMRLAAYGNLIAGAGMRDDGPLFHLRFLLNVPVNYTRSLYWKPEDILHIQHGVMAINALIWIGIAMLAWVTIRRGATRSDRILHLVQKTLSTPRQSLQVLALAAWLACIPYLALLEARYYFAPRLAPMLMITFLIWVATLRPRPLIRYGLVLILMVQSIGAYASSFLPSHRNFIAFQYDQGRALLTLLREEAKNHPNRHYYLANDPVYHSTSGKMIARAAGLASMDKLNIVMHPSRSPPGDVHRPSRIVSIADGFHLATEVPANTPIHFEASDPKLIWTSRIPGSQSFKRGDVKYHFPDLEIEPKKGQKIPKIVWGQRMEITVRAIPEDAALVFYDFFKKQWVVKVLSRVS